MPAQHQSPLRRARGGLLASVVEEIGLRVLNGAYPPGGNLPTEPEFVAELGVSRSVLREAVKILSAKGLLQARPKVGTRVCPREHWNLLDPTVLHLYCQVVDYSSFARSFQQIRATIEPEAAALAAVNRTGRQFALLEQAYRAMETASDIAGWTAADLRFHEAILDATGNPFMRPLGSLIRAALETLFAHSYASSANPFESLQVHRGVLEAIREQDDAKARACMKSLLQSTALSISKAIKTDRRRTATRLGAASRSR
jgi:DNA-binding FadR family transcriptional regulator